MKKKRTVWRRGLSACIALLLCLTLLPAAAFAAETQESGAAQADAVETQNSPGQQLSASLGIYADVRKTYYLDLVEDWPSGKPSFWDYGKQDIVPSSVNTDGLQAGLYVGCKGDRFGCYLEFDAVSAAVGTDLGQIVLTYHDESGAYEDSVVTVRVSVKKPESLWVTMDNWSVGQTPSTPKVSLPDNKTLADATVTYAKMGTDTFSPTVPTEAGTYTVKVFYNSVSASNNKVYVGTSNFVIYPPDVAINAVNFPDDVFRNDVVKLKDTNGDGFLSGKEIADVRDISCADAGISDLTGIGYFTALETLDCRGNDLTELDVSRNMKLTYLSCYDNRLTALDVSRNPELSKLNCSANQLTALDVRNNAKLSSLSCDKNRLTELDVSGNAALAYLSCYENQLTKLELSANTKLNYLNVSDNQLTALDISAASRLRSLSADNNTRNITLRNGTFDLSGLPGFDASRASGWTGGTVSGNTLTVDRETAKVTYNYDCGRDKTVLFTLKIDANAVYGFALSQTEDYVFPALSYGYTDVSRLTVTITNTGTVETGELKVKISNYSSFEVSARTIPSIPVGGTATVTVNPMFGLDTGYYGNVLIVTGDDGIDSVSQRVYMAMDVIPSEKVAAPVITPNGGRFTGEQTVTITCATEGALIVYTMDDSDIFMHSLRYTGPITLTQSATITAVAYKDNMEDSDIVTADFIIVEAPAHVHDHSTEWTADDAGHWHACSGCDDRMDLAAHTFQWVIDKEAAVGEKGFKHEECTICGYKNAAVEIPAVEEPPEDVKPPEEDVKPPEETKPSDGTESPKSDPEVKEEPAQNSATAAASTSNSPKSDAKTGSASPKTDDDTAPVLWVVLFAAGVFGVAGTAVCTRKRKTK